MKRILVGLDASPRTVAVLEAASRLSQQTGAKLVLFRSIGIPFELPVEAYSVTPAGLVDLLEQQARDDLEKLTAGLPAGMVEESVVQAGTPWQGICATAERLRADLIVIGSHGYSGLDHLLGTTAARVVNHAKQSVLVVRGHPDHAPPRVAA